jgi:hypothetical protein
VAKVQLTSTRSLVITHAPSAGASTPAGRTSTPPGRGSSSVTDAAFEGPLFEIVSV